MTHEWCVRFLELAKHVASWSKDPSTQVGAVIVDPLTKKVLGLGYNGLPRGVADTEERLNNRELKYEMIVHAEVNAILNANQSVRGAWLFVWPTLMEPNVCPNCAKVVINAGIECVFGYAAGELSDRWKPLQKITKDMFDEAEVHYGCVEVPN